MLLWERLGFIPICFCRACGISIKCTLSLNIEQPANKTKNAIAPATLHWGVLDSEEYSGLLSVATSFWWPLELILKTHKTHLLILMSVNGLGRNEI